MREETHAWLKWPGCNNARKIELNNKLAEIQNRPICPPRFLDGEVIDKLGIKHQLKKLFVTRYEERSGMLEIPIWERALNVGEEVYREWCLEFYSSLRVDKEFQNHEFYSKKLIHFRLGGKEHSKSVTEFGFLAGLFTEAECKDSRISRYLLTGKLSAKDFGAEADTAWLALTGIQKHTSSSKVSAVRIPILRLIHKLFVYSFTHRPTQHDKCYLDDLWLLDTFYKQDPTVYVCVPWVLINFMETKAAGKRADSKLCCGHFITRIAKNLNLLSTANIRACSKPVDFKRVTMHDLEVMRLLKPDHSGLIEETDVVVPTAPARERRKRETIKGALAEIKKQNEATQRMVSSLSERLEYHLDRYRPILEKLATENATASGSSLATYAPPPPFAPRSEDESSEDDEEDVNEEELGEESSEDETEDEEEQN